MIGIRELQGRNRAFFLELANCCRKSTFVLFLDKVSEGLIIETSIIIPPDKKIGTLRTSKEDANLFRQNTGNVLVAISSIPDNIKGDFNEKSIVKIGNSFNVSFELTNPMLIESKRLVTMKVFK